jgi:RNase P protein component
MSNLHATINDLAANFASSVLAAIRSASLQDLVAEQAAPRRGRPRIASTKSTPAPASSSGAVARNRGGRLARRSATDIERALVSVVAIVRKSKAGLRAEQIRNALKLESREMPRVLKTGLEKRLLKSKGQKRATTYFAV